jgi:hypothetical protein
MTAADWYAYLLEVGFIVDDIFVCPQTEAYLNVTFKTGAYMNIKGARIQEKIFPGVTFEGCSQPKVTDAEWLTWTESKTTPDGHMYRSSWHVPLDAISYATVWTPIGRTPQPKGAPRV